MVPYGSGKTIRVELVSNNDAFETRQPSLEAPTIGSTPRANGTKYSALPFGSYYSFGPSTKSPLSSVSRSVGTVFSPQAASVPTSLSPLTQSAAVPPHILNSPDSDLPPKRRGKKTVAARHSSEATTAKRANSTRNKIQVASVQSSQPLNSKESGTHQGHGQASTGNTTATSAINASASSSNAETASICIDSPLLTDRAVIETTVGPSDDAHGTCLDTPACICTHFFSRQQATCKYSGWGRKL